MLSRGFKAGMQFPVYTLLRPKLNLDKLQHHVMLPLFDTGSQLTYVCMLCIWEFVCVQSKL